ncbi:MAG: hypothetical protein KDB07_06770, partial [Planctomycetes bacterium]|nr:hypothetical protein [Planctomycetota bacterium]
FAQPLLRSRVDVTLEALAEERKAIVGDEGITDETRSARLALLDASITQVQEREQHKAATADAETRKAGFEKRAQEALGKISEAPPNAEIPSKVDANSDTSLREFLEENQESLRLANESLNTKRARTLDLKEELKHARTNLDDAASKFKALQDETPAEPATPFLKNLQSRLQDLRYEAIEAELLRREAELDALKAESQAVSLETRVDQDKVRFDSELVALVQERIATLEKSERERRKSAVEFAVDDARAAFEGAEAARAATSQVNQDTADEVVAVRKEILALRIKLASLHEKQEDAKRVLEDIQPTLDRLRDLIEGGGNSDTIGIILRNERDELPSESTYTTHAEALDAFKEELVIRQSQVGEKVRSLSRANEGNEAFGTVERSLLDAYKDLHDVLKESITRVAEVEQLEAQIVDTTREIRLFIDEKILWIRSTGLFGLQELQQLGKAAYWFLVQPDLRSTDLLEDYLDNPIVNSMAVLLIVVSFLAMKPLRRRQARIAHIVANATAAPWHFTFQAW